MGEKKGSREDKQRNKMKRKRKTKKVSWNDGEMREEIKSYREREPSNFPRRPSE